MEIQVLEQLYEGKAKKVFKTNQEDLYMIEYKDDATAFNGEKKGQIHQKGVMNMVFNEKFKAIESLFAEDKEFTVLKIEGRNAGDEQFYLAIVRYCFNNFQILLKKNKTDYTVMRISCDRDFVISCKKQNFSRFFFPNYYFKTYCKF